MTDGASAVLLTSETFARERNLPVLAFLTYGKVAAVDFVHKKEGLLMAPAYAVPRMLSDARLSLQDFDYYEIHEAFAGQVLCTLKAWNDRTFCTEKLGLPAALGTRILATLAKLLDESKAKRGLISICTAGGMGVTAILER
jgi:acetyl-CoA C-acetyltransferase